MPTFRITIDDVSPLIDYQPVNGWLQKNITTDTNGPNYYASTFTRATQLGSSASFTFNGTSITIYGGKSANHGNYTVDVDGEKRATSGFSATNQYQVPIYSVEGLDDSKHVVTITNTQYAFLDIDYMTWTSEISSATDKGTVSQLYVDDADGSFQYLPSNAWSTSIPDSNRFSNSTGHKTSNSGASVHYSFTGATLYGAGSSFNGAFSVELDGLPATTFQGSKTTYATQTLLFYASNLGYRSHTLVVTNTQDADFAIDYALIHLVDGSPSAVPSQTASPETTSSDGNTSGNTNSGNNVEKSSLTPAAIAGIAGGLLTILGLLVALCFLMRVNKSLMSRLKRYYGVQSQFTSTTTTSSSPSQTSRAITSTTSGNFLSSSNGGGDTENGYYHVASDTKVSPREAIQTTFSNRDSRELLMSPARPVSLDSNLSSGASTNSTLVAEDGSFTSGRRRFRFKRRSGRTDTATMTTQQQTSPIMPSIPNEHQDLGPSPVQQMETIHSVQDLLDLPASEHNTSENIPVISPSSSPTLSVSAIDSHLPSARASSSDNNAFWDEFIQPSTGLGIISLAAQDGHEPGPALPARVSSPTFEFDWTDPQVEETHTSVVNGGDGSTSDRIQSPEAPTTIASTG